MSDEADGDDALDAIAQKIGRVELSDGALTETDHEKGEQFGYDDSR